jgi:hypothetical protein
VGREVGVNHLFSSGDNTNRKDLLERADVNSLVLKELLEEGSLYSLGEGG